MLKHFSATFVVQFDVSQFGHDVWQQFNSIFQMAEVNMRSVEVRTMHSTNKMAAAPREVDSAEGEEENYGEEDGDDRGTIVLKELVRKYRKNKKLSERSASSNGQSTSKASQSAATTSGPNTTSSTGAARPKSAKSNTGGTSAARPKPVKSLLWTDDKISKLN